MAATTLKQEESLKYFRYREEAIKLEIARSESWQSGPVVERQIAEDRVKLEHYGNVIGAQKALYERGEVVELPEGTKTFLADEARFYDKLSTHYLRMKPSYPNALEHIQQAQVDFGLVDPAASKTQPKQELPEIPHIPKDLPIITGAGNFQREQTH